MSPSRINVSIEQQDVIKEKCLGKDSECVIPDVIPQLLSTGPTIDINMGLACTPKGMGHFGQDVLEVNQTLFKTDATRCGGSLYNNSPVITISDYLVMLDSRDSCHWDLEVTEGSFVMINVSALYLIPSEGDFWVRSLMD